MKQALLNLPEEVINHHLRDGENDIANWVESVVEDRELAQEFRKYQHRWGLIVALERQMMRTLELPAYVAARWLLEGDSEFVFVSGEKVRSVYELKETLTKVSDETIAFHCERHPNDVAVWVADVIGDYELADLLEEAVNRTQMQRFVEDHVVMLEDAREC